MKELSEAIERPVEETQQRGSTCHSLVCGEVLLGDAEPAEMVLELCTVVQVNIAHLVPSTYKKWFLEAACPGAISRNLWGSFGRESESMLKPRWYGKLEVLVILTFFSSTDMHSSSKYSSEQDRPRAHVQVLACDLLLHTNCYHAPWPCLGLCQLPFPRAMFGDGVC